jgi:tRNA (guanine-N7-)-methyltransferase
MRKSARLWRDPAARALAESALVRPGSPDCFWVEPSRLFERNAPLEVELGAGKGEFIIERAAAIPEHNFVAVELAAPVLRILALRVARTGLTNLKVLQADARTLVNLLLPDGSIGVYHVYFPDPWPKERHAGHRLFSPYFVANLARTLTPEGMIYFASDVQGYAQAIRAMFDEGGFCNASQPVPGLYSTNFGRKYAAEGRAVFSGAFGKPEAAATHSRSASKRTENVSPKVPSSML